MKTIWKYELELVNTQTIIIPKGAKILTAQMQFDRLCLWAICDIDAMLEPRDFSIYGTGNQLSNKEKLQYINTVQQHNGALVWHVFEIVGYGE